MSKEKKPSANHTRIIAAARKVPVLSMVFRRLNPRQQEIVSLLRQTVIFSELTEADLLDLLNLLHERIFVPGEMIFSEGEAGLGLYLVFKGEVEIAQKERGKEILARLGPAEVFGEVSFLDGGSRSATATAILKTELLGFYRTELLDLLKRRPGLASKILLALGCQVTLRLRSMLQSS